MKQRDMNQRLNRAIATALADDRVRRHSGDLPPATDEEERLIARTSAMDELSRMRPMDPWGTPIPVEIDDRRLIEEAVASVLGLGKLEPILDDDDITDIHVRGNAPVWVKYRDGRREQLAPLVDSDTELVDFIRRIAMRMGQREMRFDPAHPEVNLQLPDGSRMFAAMDIAQRPMFVIRRHRFDFATLRDLSVAGFAPPVTAEFLAASVRARRNIVIAGGTGSGKTTLLRALLNEVAPDERIVTIEDSYEIGLDKFEHLHPDHDCLQSRDANTEGEGEVTLSALTRMALRMDPDRVVVGEVRGAEAFPMLMAMSQGNNGSMCTMHADSARSVFPKLAAYMSMASTGVPTETLNLLIASSVHLVVHVINREGRRGIDSIHEIVDTDGLSIVTNEVFSAASPSAPFGTLRHGTSTLLREHGFHASREMAWVAS